MHAMVVDDNGEDGSLWAPWSQGVSISCSRQAFRHSAGPRLGGCSGERAPFESNSPAPEGWLASRCWPDHGASSTRPSPCGLTRLPSVLSQGAILTASSWPGWHQKWEPRNSSDGLFVVPLVRRRGATHCGGWADRSLATPAGATTRRAPAAEPTGPKNDLDRAVAIRRMSPWYPPSEGLADQGLPLTSWDGRRPRRW